MLGLSRGRGDQRKPENHNQGWQVLNFLMTPRSSLISSSPRPNEYWPGFLCFSPAEPERNAGVGSLPAEPPGEQSRRLAGSVVQFSPQLPRRRAPLFLILFVRQVEAEPVGRVAPETFLQVGDQLQAQRLLFVLEVSVGGLHLCPKRPVRQVRFLRNEQ
jgi:hypothetical protein